MTRSSDVYPTLGQRVQFANRIPNAIFVSIHFNSFVSNTAKGIETYALSPQGSGTHNDRGIRNSFLTGNRRDSENIALATAVHASVMKKSQAEDRGIKRDRFTVLAGLSMPAILVEGGFLSNPSEAKKIAMEVICLMAAMQGANKLIDVSRAHIDGCILAHDANLDFAEKMFRRVIVIGWKRFV